MSSFTIFGCSIIHPSRPSSLRAVELGLEHTLVSFLPSQVLASHVADALYWHTDYGTVTLLHQDSVGGLEVQDPNCEHLCTTAEREGVETDDLGRLSAGIYHSATPIPGTIVVNVGDLLCTSSLLTLLLSFALLTTVTSYQLAGPTTSSVRRSTASSLRPSERLRSQTARARPCSPRQPGSRWPSSPTQTRGP